MFDKSFNRRRFDNPAKVHDDHPIGDMLDHADIMADEKIGQIIGVFQINKKIDDLRLNRYIKRGNRFITNQKFR